MFPLMLGLLLIGGVAHAATLEIPTPHTTLSGIGVVSGWKCEAKGPLTVRFNGGESIPLVYGSERRDVLDAGACPHDRVGFVSIMNWGELGDGRHTAVVYDDGVEFDRSTFDVVTTGETFLRGAAGQCIVPDFPAPNENARFIWNQATQHMELAEVGDAELLSHEGEGAVIREGSGEGGIICEPAFNSEDRTHGKTITCEYREGLQSLPGAAVNWVLDDDGCLKETGLLHPQNDFRFSGLYHRFATATRDDNWYSAIDDEPDSDANWYLVRRWYLSYGHGRWGVSRPTSYRDGLIVPVPDDEPEYWNQHKYYSKEIPFDDQASYHLRQLSSGIAESGTAVPADYIQYQFYALGPVSSGGWDGRSPCFRDIPQVPAP